MDFMGTVLNERYSEMVSSLVLSGFTKRQAINFIPMAVSQLFCAGRVGGTNENVILDKIDIQELAKDMRLDEPLVNSGLQQLLPFMNANNR